jgi:crossover junction endodeoxyribonuclease RusA
MTTPPSIIALDPATKSLSFFVPGIPVPGGSKRAFVNKYTGRASVTDAAGERNTNWRACVAHEAHMKMDGAALMEGPLRLEVVFCMPRPKKHFRTGRNANLLRSDAPEWHTSTPDTTKLLRAVEDALTGIVWKDDRQVAYQFVLKKYDSHTGAQIIIKTM